MKFCVSCSKRLIKKQRIYCSNRCQTDYQYRVYINNWIRGIVNGTRGVMTKALSGHLRRFLFEKNGSKCSLCGWNKYHPILKYVPLEIDHIDGNAENNIEENLRLLCPNCHSLTVHYKNLNKGNGRKWRRETYIKVRK